MLDLDGADLDFRIEVSPLRADPLIGSQIEQAILASAELLAYRMGSMRAGALVAAELVSNVYYHSNWQEQHKVPPSVSVWINRGQDEHLLRIRTVNAISDRSVLDRLHDVAQKLENPPAALESIAARLAEMGSESVHEQRAGIGLLRLSMDGGYRLRPQLRGTNVLVLEAVVPLRLRDFADDHRF